MNANDQADANIIVDRDAGWVDQETNILNQLQGILDSSQLDAVFCVAGKKKYTFFSCAVLHINYNVQFKKIIIIILFSQQVAGPVVMPVKTWLKMPI